MLLIWSNWISKYEPEQKEHVSVLIRDHKIRGFIWKMYRQLFSHFSNLFGGKFENVGKLELGDIIKA